MNDTEENKTKDSSKSGIPSSSSESEGSTAGVDLVDRLKDVEGVTDEFAEFIAKNWQHALTGLVLILLTVWLVTQYRVVQENILNEASLGFNQVQTAFWTYKTESLSDKKEDAENLVVEVDADIAKDAPASEDTSDSESSEPSNIEIALNDAVAMLTQDSSSTSYGKLAVLYGASVAMTRGNIGAAREQLSRFDLSIIEGEALDPVVDVEVRASAIADEIASLMYVKSLLFDNVSDIDSVRIKLKNLCLRSRFVSVEAWISLLLLAKNQDERSDVVNVAQQIITVHPELGDLLREEARRLGVTLKSPASAKA